jgi:hypothetical protein
MGLVATPFILHYCTLTICTWVDRKVIVICIIGELARDDNLNLKFLVVLVTHPIYIPSCFSPHFSSPRNRVLCGKALAVGAKNS